MANPISKLNLVINGATTQLDIHDANAVDLTNNQTVGGIKAFSNAPVVGSILLDGKTIDTDANGNMTYDGHIVDTIEEQGDGYIRYSNGIQICWGSMDFGSIGAGDDSSMNWIFSKSFVNSSYIAVCGNSSTGSQWMYQSFITFDKTTTLVKIAVTNNGVAVSGDSLASLIAIGRWK